MSQEVDNRPSQGARLTVLILFVSLALAIGVLILFREGGDRASTDRLGPPGDSPVWNTQIAFRSNRAVEFPGSIYLINSDGSGLRELLPSDNRPTTVGNPAWSPDGKWVAYQSRKFGQPDIFAVRENGQGEVGLTNDPELEDELAWSPDGESIVFTSQGRIDGSALYIHTVGGSSRGLPTKPQSHASSPSWSPDGKRIVFALASSALVDTSIYVINSDGTELRRLPGPPRGGRAPDWSRDGRRIVLSDGGDIWTIHPDGSNLTRLTRTKKAKEADPVWSPDGSMIAFTRVPPLGEIGPDCPMCSASPELWIMNADGSRARRLLKNREFKETRSSVEGLSWQPLPRLTPLRLAIPTPSPIPSPKGTDLTKCPSNSNQPARPGGRPSTFVGSRRDGRVVVANTANGEIDRVLATFASSPMSPEAISSGGAEVHHVSLSSDGSHMFFSTGSFGEGTGPRQNRGYIWHACTSGGEPEKVILGSDPEVSQDGRLLAFVRSPELVILNLEDGSEHILRNLDPIHQVSSVAWSRDSGSLAVQTNCPECGGAVRLLDIKGNDLLGDSKELGPPPTSRIGTGWVFPAFRRDGMLRVTEYCCALDAGSYDGGTWELIVHPATGRVRERNRTDRPFARIDYDSFGNHQLILRLDEEQGQVLRRTTGGAVKIADGYWDADW